MTRGVRGPNTPWPTRPDFAEFYQESPSECWEWRGYVDVNGYGKGYDGHTAERPYDWAHRIAYRRAKGAIPDGYDIDHVCENTRCVNPEHLDAVTRADHIRRTMARLGKDARHERAAYLRSMRLTYAEIAEALGYSDKAGAHDAVLAAIEKGLVDPATCPPDRRLNDLEREEIAELHHVWGVPQADLARMYRIDNSHVSRITSGRRSGHDQGVAA